MSLPHGESVGLTLHFQYFPESRCPVFIIVLKIRFCLLTSDGLLIFTLAIFMFIFCCDLQFDTASASNLPYLIWSDSIDFNLTAMHPFYKTNKQTNEQQQQKPYKSPVPWTPQLLLQDLCGCCWRHHSAPYWCKRPLLFDQIGNNALFTIVRIGHKATDWCHSFANLSQTASKYPPCSVWLFRCWHSVKQFFLSVWHLINCPPPHIWWKFRGSFGIPPLPRLFQSPAAGDQ